MNSKRVMCPSGLFGPLLLLMVASLLPAVASDTLKEIFLNPPEEAKSRGYWVWPHGNFDYLTIRRELAEFNNL